MAPFLVSAAGGGSLRKDYRLGMRIILRAVLDDRSIEDKLQQHKLELRDLRVGLNMKQLHGNADRPAFYQGWLAVPDTMLPARGTGYRAQRGEDAKEMRAAVVNELTSSELWRLQGLVDPLPPALNEQDFHLPACKAFLQSNETRKNMTDLQETSQWIAGEAF